MGGRLLETAVRPIRLAFLLGKNPSTRLINSVISINSGLWGGIYNFICPTDGNAISDEYLEMFRDHHPDCIVFCGKFNNKQNLIHQLEQYNINPSCVFKGTGLESIESFGLGIEGIFDNRFLRNIQHGPFVETAVVNPRSPGATIADKVVFGIPPERIKEYIEDRVDFITVHHYKNLSKISKSTSDELIGIIQMTGENLVAQRTLRGYRLPTSRLGRLYCVVGNEDSLNDALYFWNLRAIFGADKVSWVPRNDLKSFLGRRKVAYSPRATLTAVSITVGEDIKRALRVTKRTARAIRYSEAKAILRMRQNWLWQSELKTQHIASDSGELIIPVSSPSSFELLYPPRHLRRWVMDLRMVRNEVIKTEGFVLPTNLPYLTDVITPTGSSRLRTRIIGDTFSLQVTAARVDEYIRFRIPTDWEVIQTIFKHSGCDPCLSSQGNYMSRALGLFGGLPRLCELLIDKRSIAILDEFKKRHQPEAEPGSPQYRRALTLEDMIKVVLNLVGKGSKKKEETVKFVDQLLNELIGLGAIHSGYVLDCSQCNLEEWYPIDEVGENYRCRRCLATETRPLSPPVSFRLNEALYQAYSNNFAVPVLILGLLERACNSSFIFSPQIRLKASDSHSPELDIVAICDGDVTIGEAKSNNRIAKRQLDFIESIARAIGARRIVLGTTSRQSCSNMDCKNCSENDNYADNAFTHGLPDPPQSRGTREHISDLRNRLSKDSIKVTSICPQDIVQGDMERISI